MRHWNKWVLLALVLVAPLAAVKLYSYATRLPNEIVVASGTPGGRYHALASALASAVESGCGMRVRILESSGSIENVGFLRDGEAAFGFYQATLADSSDQSADKPTAEDSSQSEPLTLLGRLYSEYVFLVVSSGARIGSAADLRGQRINVGVEGSGNQVLTRAILDHYELTENTFVSVHEPYDRLVPAFRAGELDAAFIVSGAGADVVEELLKSGECELRELDHIDALVAEHPELSRAVIPSATYGYHPEPLPPDAIQTIAVPAQLICRGDIPDRVVEEVVKLLVDKEFLQENGLTELRRGGVDFARAGTSFPLHRAAEHVYDPSLKPLVDADFMEATEGLRSFIVSIAIAGFLLFRWFVRYRARKKDHELDRYIRDLLEIERKQVDLDTQLTDEQLKELEALLDRVTFLRQDALKEFSAHQLNEDRGVDVFLEMCHALTDKMSGKLLRSGVERLRAELVQGRSSGSEFPGA